MAMSRTRPESDPIRPENVLSSPTSGEDLTDFSAVYEKYSREIWSVVYARWLNADTALDITQEAFLRLWKKQEEGEVILNPRAWLLRVARNLAEDVGKSAFHRNGTHPPQTMNGVCSRESMPLDHLEREETFHQLREVLRELATADREILTLRYALDYDTQRIAKTLNINEPAVHMRLSRARQRLADRLQSRGICTVPE